MGVREIGPVVRELGECESPLRTGRPVDRVSMLWYLRVCV